MRRPAGLFLLVVIGVTACSSSTATSPRQTVTVFAAASLTEAFNDQKASLPTLAVTYSFAGSDALVAQILNGAPADVVATASTATMKTLSDAGLVEPSQTFARNQLEILVQPGNPKHVATIADLARTDITFVTEADTVPAGKYTAQMLQAAGITAHPVSQETDVKSAVARVTSGEADATVVYTTDVLAAGSNAEGVEIPAAQNVIASYPIAIVKATTHHAAAAAFLAAILGPDGQADLQRHGFLVAA